MLIANKSVMVAISRTCIQIYTCTINSYLF